LSRSAVVMKASLDCYGIVDELISKSVY